MWLVPELILLDIRIVGSAMGWGDEVFIGIVGWIRKHVRIATSCWDSLPSLSIQTLAPEVDMLAEPLSRLAEIPALAFLGTGQGSCPRVGREVWSVYRPLFLHPTCPVFLPWKLTMKKGGSGKCPPSFWGQPRAGTHT